MRVFQNTPIAGPGRLQWNAGGWWGSSLGATAWMIPTAVILIANNQPLLAFLPVIGFLLMNLLAAVLWVRRDRVLPFKAVMVLFGSVAVVIPAVWVGVARFGTADSLARMNWTESRIAVLGVLFIGPALIMLFGCLEYSRNGKLYPGTSKHKTAA